jgi:phage shock protein PspC (stress-responsive transcriptional regulator)
MLGGVCAGLGRYLGIDPTIIRLFFVILVLASGSGFLVYFLLWIIIPRDDQLEGASTSGPHDFGDRARQVGEEFGEAVRRRDPNTGKFIGFALVAAGIVFLIDNLHLPWLVWLRGEFIWPALLIFGGVALLVRALRKD